MILVQKDQNGQIIVRETGDHLGRKGAGYDWRRWLARWACRTTAVGLGGGWRRCQRRGELVAKHKVVDSLEGGLGDNLKPGQAVVLAIVEEEYLLSAQQALDDSLAKSLAAMDEGGAKGLKAALNEARGKFNPDRTILPIPDRKFGGAIARTMDEAVADYSFYPRPQASSTPNVLLVLIDDAGFGGVPGAVRW